MKKYILIVIVILVTIVGVRFAWKKINSDCIVMMEQEIKTKYEFIEKLSISDYGPHCRVLIYVKNDSIDYQIVEPVLIEVIRDLSKIEIHDYLIENHNKSTGGEIAFFHVYFYQDDENEIYRFTSYKDFVVWENEADRNNKYYVSDYIQ